MQQSGEFRIPAARADVWRALNDPAVLQQCIDGCESMERVDDTHFTATVKAKVGPVSATFAGDVTLTDLDPPTSYTLVGSGKGGAAGFARGEAKVRLVEEAPALTLLQYEMDAKVGGKLAQIGSRLIDGAARKMADDFFGRFSVVVAGAPPAEAAATAPSAAEDAARSMAESAAGTAAGSGGPRKYESGDQRWVWLVVFGVVVLALVLAAL